MEPGKFLKIVKIALALLCFANDARANILWMGGEDIDFPNGYAVCVNTNSNSFRSGYARESLYPCTTRTLSVSQSFPGGAITSGWLSVRVYSGGWWAYAPGRYAGFVKSGTQKSLWIGNDSSDTTKVALWKYDGSTWTELATSATGILTGSATIRLDMQVTNYGSSATANIYVGGATSPAVTYSGDVTAGGNTSVDSVAVSSDGGNWSSSSEIFVSDSDSRSLSMVTLAPNAAGTTNQWTGSYSNVNPTAINDSSHILDNNAGDTFEAKLNSLPAGSFSIQALKIVTRAAKTPVGIGSLSIGVYTNGAANFPSTVSLPAGWSNYETYYSSSNPVTSSNWSSSDINSLQIDLQTGP